MVKVSVTSGKVQLATAQIKQSIILTAGETGEYQQLTKRLYKLDRHHANASAWKTKVLRFNEMDLMDVIDEVASYFDVQLTIADGSMKYCVFTGRFP